jgi:hypothetical protein
MEHCSQFANARESITLPGYYRVHHERRRRRSLIKINLPA